eukprot:gene23356-30611_t
MAGFVAAKISEARRFVYITKNNLQMIRSGPCFHCQSTDAPTWRKNLEDRLCCNKCGLKGGRALKAGGAVKKKKAKSADAPVADTDAAAVKTLPPGGKRRRKTSSQGKAAAATTTAAAKGGGSAMALQQQQEEEDNKKLAAYKHIMCGDNAVFAAAEAAGGNASDVASATAAEDAA